MQTVVDVVRNDLEEAASARVSVFGHSFGALLAFLVASELQKEGYALSTVILSSYDPELVFGGPPIASDLADASLRSFFHALGGIEPCLLADEAFMRYAVSRLKRDLALWAGLSRTGAAVLTCNVVAMGGSSDPYVSADCLGGWGRWARGHFETQLFFGSHFYFKGAERQLAARMIPLLFT